MHPAQYRIVEEQLLCNAIFGQCSGMLPQILSSVGASTMLSLLPLSAVPFWTFWTSRRSPGGAGGVLGATLWWRAQFIKSRATPLLSSPFLLLTRYPFGEPQELQDWTTCGGRRGTYVQTFALPPSSSNLSSFVTALLLHVCHRSPRIWRSRRCSWTTLWRPARKGLSSKHRPILIFLTVLFDAGLPESGAASAVHRQSCGGRHICLLS